MEIKGYIIILLLYLELFTLQISLCKNIKANVICSSTSSSCTPNAIISELSDGIRIDTSMLCGTCRLELNTTIENHIHVEIDSSLPWTQLHHLYFTNDNVISGFTETPEQCGIVFPTNIVRITYKLDAAFTINIRDANQTDQCLLPDTVPCDLQHNCNGLSNFNNVQVLNFEKRESTLESNFLHPTVNMFYGDVEIGGDLPHCPPECTCSLHFQSVVAHCGAETKRTLLVYPTLTGLNPLIVLITGLSNHDPVTAFDASRKRLQSIDPNSFQDLNYMNRISLNHNLLTHISSGTFGWFELAILSIADNKLTTLDSNIFEGLTFLLLLDLQGNQLTALHPNLFRTTRLLLGVDLSGNNLQEILPETFDPLSEIGTVILNQNNITSLQKQTFRGTKRIQWLYMNDNQLETIEPGTFDGLRLFRLQLSGNRFSVINPEMFQGAENLKELVISRNNISTLPPSMFSLFRGILSIRLDYNQLKTVDLQPFSGLQQLLGLNLSGNHLTYFDYGLENKHSNKTSLLPRLRLLLLNDNKLQNINGNIFKEMPDIESFQIRGNPLKRVDRNTFKKVQNRNGSILVDEPATCCFIDENSKCLAKNRREPYLTCLRLLPYPSVRVMMWILGLFAFIGNLSVLLWRCVKHGKEKIVQRLLIENLAASDLLMGMYMLIVASADAYYQQYFPSESDSWRNGPWCKVAGTLSVLSSEGSVFFITLISIDRFLAIKYPGGKWRLTKKSLTITLIVLWSFAFLLSIVPTSVSGRNPDFYDVSEVCIGLPFVRAPVFLNRSVIVADFQFEADDLYSLVSSARDDVYYEQYIYPETGNNPGLYFSIVLFLGVNLLCFIIVAICYISIFYIVKQSTRSVGKFRRDQEIILAIRMGAIVITDFMCWVPIVVIGILVQSAVVTIRPVVYVYIVVFILPINSAVNPYIYTIAIAISDYRARRKVKRGRNDTPKTKIKTISKTSSEGEQNSQSMSLSNQATSDSNM